MMMSVEQCPCAGCIRWRNEHTPIESDEKHDAVNHPSHYTSHPSGVECITVVEHMTFNAGNAVKYLWRAGLKTDDDLGNLASALQDLKKSRWYLDREIERLEKETKP